MKKIIIFDLDGTLYELKGDSYDKSLLKKEVVKNAEKYITKKLRVSNFEAKKILIEIKKKYNEGISIGLEKEYGLSRYDYFNNVWDINASKLVRYDASLCKTLNKLSKNYELIILSDAPRVWMQNVFKALKIGKYFKKNNIFSGESDIRKSFGNAFEYILRIKKVKPENCISVGDQLNTDILPAKKLGMKTIYINKKIKKSDADFTIKNINFIYSLSDLK